MCVNQTLAALDIDILFRHVLERSNISVMVLFKPLKQEARIHLSSIGTRRMRHEGLASTISGKDSNKDGLQQSRMNV